MIQIQVFGRFPPLSTISQLTIEQEIQMAKSTGQASVEEALEEDFSIR